MSKIQIFESNSQLINSINPIYNCCFRCQRYKFLKAIHNTTINTFSTALVVSDVKDTNFWKQFTTPLQWRSIRNQLFPMSKIQIFESNSQHQYLKPFFVNCCFRCQRYKFLKAIHNHNLHISFYNQVVSDVKDTNFWKQFTTTDRITCVTILLFPMSKIQIFESNSQPILVI